jgi:hypothetical protein
MAMLPNRPCRNIVVLFDVRNMYIMTKSRISQVRGSGHFVGFRGTLDGSSEKCQMRDGETQSEKEVGRWVRVRRWYFGRKVPENHHHWPSTSWAIEPSANPPHPQPIGRPSRLPAPRTASNMSSWWSSLNPFAGVNAEEAKDDDKDNKDEAKEKSTAPVQLASRRDQMLTLCRGRG